MNNLKKKNEMIHPASLYIEKLRTSKKIGSKGVMEKIQKAVDDYKKGEKTLEFAIVTDKKFLVNKHKRFDFDEVVPHGKTAKEVFNDTINGLSFICEKEKFKEEFESFIAQIKNPDFLDKVDCEGHLLFKDMIEVQIREQERYLEFSNYTTKIMIDLTQ